MTGATGRKTWDVLARSRELFANEWSSVDWVRLGKETQEVGILQLESVFEVVDTLQLLHKRVQKCMLSSRRPWEQKVEALRELERFWSNFTPARFVQFMEVLGPECRQFLDCLTVAVPTAEIPALRRQRKAPGRTLTRVTIFEGEEAFPYESKDTWLLDSTGRTLTDFGAKRTALRRHVLDDGILGFSYTTLVHLMNKHEWRQARDVEAVYIVNALSHTTWSGAFQSILGRAVLTQIWKDCQRMYYVRMSFSTVNLFILFLISYYGRHRWVPPALLVFPALLMGIWSLSLPFIELLTACRMYGPKAGIFKYMTQWNLVSLVLEVYCGVCVCMTMQSVLQEYGELVPREIGKAWLARYPCVKGCFLFDHPVFWSNTIMVKWAQLIFSLLCTRNVGEHVLPAFEAVTSKPSVYFLVFLGLVVLMTFNGYWSYPIEENVPHKVEVEKGNITFSREPPIFSIESVYATLFTFMKVYRLDMLGDADLWELEGLDPVFDGSVNMTTGVLDGGLDDPEPNRKWHIGINFYFTVVSATVSVALMSVYVGLLSNLYDESKRRTRQLHGHFLAKYAFKLLLFRIFWNDLKCFLCPCSRRCSCSSSEVMSWESASEVDSSSLEEEFLQRSTGGVWISYDHETVQDDSEEVHERLESLYEMVHELKREKTF
eukprot:TRINITY_DN24166_c0_g3_i1.p1 TRINITY_DN24166_c0_g3~~TRINITY_DN24166_c0_g3_i1.p1  ORF type:complete len:659 (+),score=128.40 TRINITY_DN24166_c0_g3_i1:191-2167(+)